MRNLLTGLALICVLTSAHGASFEQSIGVGFPDTLAGFTFSGREAFAQKQLGINVAYEGDGPVRASLFIYDGGQSGIAAGVDSPKVRKHFSQVISEVQQLAASGKLKALTLATAQEQTTAYSGCGPQFIWREFEMVLADSRALTSFTYLTALEGHYVKLRVSFTKDTPRGRESALQFVHALRKLLGRCA